MKFQVVFVMDTKLHRGRTVENHHRSQCLACTQVLLSWFPNKEHPNQIQWNCKFFSSATPTSSLRVNTSQFQEPRSELIEKFFDELWTHLKACPSEEEENVDWARCVYGALAATVQDFIWDAPEIKSPVRPSKRRKSKDPSCDSSLSRNVIFLFSEGPRNESGYSSPQDTYTALVNQVLPKPLLTHLQSKNIQVCWVYTGDEAPHTGAPHTGGDRCGPSLEALTKAMESVGGMVIPLKALLGRGSPVLPPSVHLTEHLSRTRFAGDGGREQLNQDRLLWLCCKDDSVICIVELRSVCKSAHQLDSTAHQLNEPDCKMVVLGVVKQSAVSFDLLEPAPACWCASFSVPSVTGKVLSGQTALGHLKESGRREHSHQYQNLCLWLAANGLLLLVKVPHGTGRDRIAILQPASSLVSTLCYVRPRHHEQLELLQVTHPLSLHTPVVPSSRSSVNLSNRMEMTSLGEHSDSDAARKNGARVVTDAELRVSILSRLDHTPPSPSPPPPPPLPSSSSSAVGTAVRNLRATLPPDSPEEPTPPFTHTPLLPWFPYTQTSGVKGRTLQCLRELQVDSLEIGSPALKGRKMLIQQLREFYSASSQHVGTLIAGDTLSPSEDMEEGGEEEEEEEGRGEEEVVVQESSPTVSKEELFRQFQLSYEDQLGTEDVDFLYHWVSEALPRLLQQVAKVGAPGDPSDTLLPRLLLTSELLLGPTELAEKYASGESGKNTNEVNEYILQVLLHFEASCSCQELAQDPGLPDKLIVMLRKVSLLRNPRLLGSLMGNLVLPMYIKRCREVVTEVFRGLMLPLPPDIEESSSSPGPMDEEEEGEGQGEGMEPMSLEQPIAPRGAETRQLARHKSFQEVSTRRLITMPRKKGPREGKKSKHSSVVQELLPLLALRRSPRISRRTAATAGAVTATRRKSVCRSLFNRSHTISGSSDVGGRRKRAKDSTKGSDKAILVHETPLKLQQQQQQQVGLMTRSPGMTIKESPHRSFRSFYSSGRVSKKRLLRTPDFKTPPTSLSRRVLLPPLNSDPSPSTIHSLLHDNFTATPHAQQQQQQGTSPLVAATTTPPEGPTDILSSEELFKSHLSQQMSGDSRLKRTSVHYKSARMLTYEKEEPLEAVVMPTGPAGNRTPVKTRTPIKIRTPSKNIRTLFNSTRTPIIRVIPTKSDKFTIGSPSRTFVTFTRTPTKSRTSPLPPGTPVMFTRTPTKSPAKFRTPICSGTPIKTPTKSTPTKSTPPLPSGTPVMFTRTPTKSRTTPPFSGMPIRTAAKTPTRTPVKSTRTPVKSVRTPVKSIGTPVKSTRLPVKYTRTPVKSTRTPVKSTRTPVKSTRTPVGTQTNTPVESPTATPTRFRRLRSLSLVKIPRAGEMTKSTTTTTTTTPEVTGMERTRGGMEHADGMECARGGMEHGTVVADGIECGAEVMDEVQSGTEVMDGVVLVSPPSTNGDGNDDGHQGKPWHLLADLDPGLMMQESASMAAFALSTPTKDDPQDFRHAF